MADRIRCQRCKAESISFRARLVCANCYRQQQAEIERLRQQLADIRSALPTEWTEGDCVDWTEEGGDT